MYPLTRNPSLPSLLTGDWQVQPIASQPALLRQLHISMTSKRPCKGASVLGSYQLPNPEMLMNSNSSSSKNNNRRSSRRPARCWSRGQSTDREEDNSSWAWMKCESNTGNVLAVWQFALSYNFQEQKQLDESCEKRITKLFLQYLYPSTASLKSGINIKGRKWEKETSSGLSCSLFHKNTTSSLKPQETLFPEQIFPSQFGNLITFQGLSFLRNFK